MKNLITLALASMVAVSALAQHEVSCSFTSISSNITSNTTLSSSTLYRLEGCIHVNDGVTLTIPAGTVIMGQKSSNATLIIDKGGKLASQGTSSNPVVFTSDQTSGNQLPGDWGGIAVLGKATNNQSNSITIESRTCSITGGGTADDDNSGVFKFMRIEFPSYGLTMLSVGNTTEFHDVQVSYAGNDAFELYGGTVRAKDLISFNAKGADIVSKFGNRSLVQYVINLRPDGTAHLSSGDASNSIVMGNTDNSPFTGTPANHPVFSNVSILGPIYCGGSAHADFKNGILYYRNTQGGVYNSLVAGWPNNGLRIEDNSTLANADKTSTPILLNFFYNSFYNLANDYSSSAWLANCASTMDDWMQNAASPCGQPGNQFTGDITTLGYSSTICGTYSTTAPSFILSSTDLDVASFPSSTDLDNAFFASGTQKRGATNASTDWTTSWAEWNPKGRNYCTSHRDSPTGINTPAGTAMNDLKLAPNPANGITYAEFTSDKSGKVTITVVNSLGQVVKTISRNIEAGSQRIAISTDGLSAGMYIVKLDQGKGNNMRSRFIVK